MQYSPLCAVRHRISIGVSLPFDVYRKDGSLLLARGQMINSQAELDALLQRGAMVALAALQSPGDVPRHAPAEQLPTIWRHSLNRLADVLSSPEHHGFADAVDAVTPAVLDLIARDKDLAIFQIIKRNDTQAMQFGVRQALQCAIASFLVAQRLGWQDSESSKAFKLGLTMDLSIMELRGQLAEQNTPLTGAQRDAIHGHPAQSEKMLRLAGVDDEELLRAVARHHENPDGSGYPHGCREPGDLAQLAQRAGTYIAMLSRRLGREAMSADRAGRMMFMQDGGHPMTAALVKEFGLYPPGCFVRLASGETGIVVKRGKSVMTPIVAALTTPYGSPLTTPIHRDSAERAYCIHGALADCVRFDRIDTETLLTSA